MSHKRLYTAGLTLALLLALGAGLSLPATLAQDGEGSDLDRTINVSGIGTVEAVPDVLQAQIGVETEDANLSEALSNNNARMDAVIARLRELGIAQEDIQTVNFSISDRRDREGNITGFFVNNAVQVTVRNLDDAGPGLDAAVQAGANRINGIQLAISDPAPLIERARELAMQDARARANQLTQAAGMTLGKPIQINEAGGGGLTSKARAASLDGFGESVPISGGQLSVSVNVNVTYEMH